MLRLTIAFVFALAIGGAANAADRAVPRHGWHRAVMLPAGLPRPHYRFRTTISYDRQPVPRLSVYETPAVLYAAGYVDVPDILPVRAPLLLPGYYGTAYPYSYPGAYHGAPYVPYWDRLPYACGVYGYC
jgi:hypothetical protein